ncbi:MAG: hypothetical protein ACKV2U_02875 [Bryobacteraceae bacterium]
MSSQIRGFHFYHREEVRSKWNVIHATDFLRGFRGDAAAIRSLRELVVHRTGIPSLASGGDSELFARVAQMMAAGQLVMAAPRKRMTAPTIRAVEETPVAPPPQKKASVSVVLEDEPTFGGNLRAALQAATLLAASATGVPFCEECSRMSKQRE